MPKECTCRNYIIGGIVQHHAHCEIWDAEKCGYCGGTLETGDQPREVNYRGEAIIVCSGCYRTQFQR